MAIFPGPCILGKCLALSYLRSKGSFGLVLCLVVRLSFRISRFGEFCWSRWSGFEFCGRLGLLVSLGCSFARRQYSRCISATYQCPSLYSYHCATLALVAKSMAQLLPARYVSNLLALAQSGLRTLRLSIPSESIDWRDKHHTCPSHTLMSYSLCRNQNRVAYWSKYLWRYLPRSVALGTRIDRICMSFRMYSSWIHT